MRAEERRSWIKEFRRVADSCRRRSNRRNCAFAPAPLVTYERSYAELYSGLAMTLAGCLGALMVSTLRYPSFKSLGTSKRSTPMIILLVASVGMLIWLFSRYVLLVLGVGYLLYGLLLRFASIFRRKTPPQTSSPI
jgi:phosphatidylserine synthase